MRATIRSSDQTERVFENGTQGFFIVIDEALHGKLGLQFFFYGQVEQRVDRMFALLLGHFRHGTALEVGILFQVDVIDKGLVPAEHSQLTLLAVGILARHNGRGLFHIGFESRPPTGVGQLHAALFQSADRGLVPGRELVKQAHGFQCELKLNRHADVDRQDRRFLILPARSRPIARARYRVKMGRG